MYIPNIKCIPSLYHTYTKNLKVIHGVTISDGLYILSDWPSVLAWKPGQPTGRSARAGVMAAAYPMLSPVFVELERGDGSLPMTVLSRNRYCTQQQCQ
jgi:hypothetical protein